MIVHSLLQYGLFIVIVVALVKPVGTYLQRVFEGQHTWLDPVVGPLERALYRAAGVQPSHEMSAREYALSLVCFTFLNAVLLYAILRLQNVLPAGPDQRFLTTPMRPDLALNTAISFSTATSWQAYAGETTLKYAAQVLGLVTQNIVAGASGLAVGIAFIRGFARRESATIGNFWVDLTRAVLRVLLPIALAGSLLLVWQGVPMNFSPYVHAVTLERHTQTIAQGPVAALVFVENLGTNGGGFFGVNGAHPYQNPNGFTNLLEMLAIVVIPAALTHTFGRMVRQRRAGWVLFAVMLSLFVVGLLICDLAERGGNPALRSMGVSGGNMEGKEVRFGIGGSVLTAVVTSNGATGAYNSMHDSYTPIGVLVPLSNMALGEIVFGGLGTGLFSLVIIALVGLFLAGLMVGRIPEYLGKKIGPGEIKLAMIFTLAFPLVILLLTALAVRAPAGLEGLTTNSGAHGFTEILFAFTSAAANNGQSMAGLKSNAPFYNVTTAWAMIVGRFFLMIPALALAGRFAAQRRRPPSAGTVPADGLTFAALTIGAAILIGALCFLPFLTLGPILEYLSLR